MTVGQNIKKFRKEKGLTQKQLGELTGIDEANIRKYELCKQNPKIETVMKIADGLGISPVDLIGPEWESLNYEARTQHYSPFLQYLGFLGYKIFSDFSPESFGNVTIQRPNGGYIVVAPDGKEKTTFTGDQFKEFEKAIADSVEYQLWQQRNKK